MKLQFIVSDMNECPVSKSVFALDQKRGFKEEGVRKDYPGIKI